MTSPNAPDPTLREFVRALARAAARRDHDSAMRSTVQAATLIAADNTRPGRDRIGACKRQTAEMHEFVNC